VVVTIQLRSVPSSEEKMQLNWGIAGAGNVAHDFCVALRTLPRSQHRIKAVSARSLERAKEFASIHEISSWYGSYNEMFNDQEINIVYIATVNSTHLAIVLQALKHGKHVLCEKPMGVNKEEVEEIARFAKQKQLFVMEGLWSFFLPSWNEIALQIKLGAIGKPKLMTFMHSKTCYQQREKFYSRELAGGMLTSIGEYPLAFAYMIFKGKNPVKITATGINFKTGVDKSHSLTMIFEDGEILTSFISCDVNYLENAEIIGEKGKVRLNAPFWCPTVVHTPNAELSFQIPKGDMETKFTNSAAFSYEAQHVRKCLMSGRVESNILPHEVSLTIAGWMDKIRQQLGVLFDQDEADR